MYSVFVQDGMEETVFSSWLVPRYYAEDTDGYDYGIKFPDYLSLTGNLSVGVPSTELFANALIIWPKVDGTYEYGVLLNDNSGNRYQIYIDSDGNSVYPEFEPIVSQYRDIIVELLNRAEAYWKLSSWR